MGHEWDQPGVRMPAQREGVPSGERRKSQPAASGFDLESDAAVAGRYDHSRSAMHAFQWWCEQWARECLRVLKPGGHIAAFGGARTSHRLACAIEDAGFEIRDSIVWLFGQGFPKSLNVSKAIAKRAGGALAAREAVEWMRAERERRGMSRSELERAIFGRVDGNVRNWEDGISIPEAGLWRRIREALGCDETPFDAAMERGDVEVGRAGGDFGYQRDGERWQEERVVREPTTELAHQWDGWGTALKPAHEPVVVGRKPLSESNVAANVLKHGTGAINVDACRLDAAPDPASWHAHRTPSDGGGRLGQKRKNIEAMNAGLIDPPSGRWPANVVLTHAEDCRMVGQRPVRSNGHFPRERGASGYGSAIPESNGGGLKGQNGLEERRFDGEVVDEWECVEGCPVRALDEQVGVLRSGTGAVKKESAAGWQSGSMAGRESRPYGTPNIEYGDEGGASRFYFCGKASRLERNAGLDGFEEKEILWSSGEQSPGTFQSEGTERRQKNHHSTVKPIDLMRWLVRLFVPLGGVVVDPFVGSGTTGCACALEGVQFIGIEREPEYVRIAEARVRYWASMPVGMETERILRAELARPERSGQLSMM